MPIIEGGGLRTNAGAPSAGTDEVQNIEVGGTPTGGTFTLTFDGFETAAIAWSGTNATLIANIDAALEALPNIPTGGVTTASVDLLAGIGNMSVTFASDLAKQAQPLMTADASLLTGTAPTVVVTETTPGVTATGRGATKGALLTDTTNALLYINTGTALAPTWTKVGTQT